MKRILFQIIFFQILFSFIFGLNCYSCSGSTGCNDPFNSFGSGVSTTGSISAYTYCVKRYLIGTVERFGSSSCSSYWYSSNAYQYCCQTDFCNSSKRNKSFLLLIFLLFQILFLF